METESMWSEQPRYVQNQNYQLENNKPKRILVVDDESEIRLHIAEMLVNKGYKVATARDGLAALRYLESQNELPDLIMLDLRMPVKDGPTFIQEKKQNAAIAHIPVVVISGDWKSLEEGHDAQGYLGKPIEAHEIYDVVEQLTS